MPLRWAHPDTNKKNLLILLRHDLDGIQKISNNLVMRKQFEINIGDVICQILSTTDSFLVDPQPFFLSILRVFSVRDQDVTTTASGERILVVGSVEP